MWEIVPQYSFSYGDFVNIHYFVSEEYRHLVSNFQGYSECSHLITLKCTKKEKSGKKKIKSFFQKYYLNMPRPPTSPTQKKNLFFSEITFLLGLNENLLIKKYFIHLYLIMNINELSYESCRELYELRREKIQQICNILCKNLIVQKRSFIIKNLLNFNFKNISIFCKKHSFSLNYLYKNFRCKFCFFITSIQSKEMIKFFFVI